ncbi:MAG: hypothetical protein NT080_05240 [Spirochaetes bacterium]|nr:hypothetical protein [Spirochaetota bacterium]
MNEDSVDLDVDAGLGAALRDAVGIPVPSDVERLAGNAIRESRRRLAKSGMILQAAAAAAVIALAAPIAIARFQARARFAGAASDLALACVPISGGAFGDELACAPGSEASAALESLAEELIDAEGDPF